MNSRIRVISCTLALCLCATTSSYALDDGSAEAVIADAIVARPACLVATVVGSAFFVVALPFAAMSKSVKKTAKVLVVKPARATFTRPLGDFSSLD
jgi:hypothetical protein